MLQVRSGGELDDKTRSQLLSLYDSLATEFPRAHSAKRLPLEVAVGKQFRKRVDGYMRAMMRRAVPSLFQDLRKLIREDAGKAKVIDNLVEDYIKNLS